VDLAREQTIAKVLAAAARDGLVSAAHDLSDGGLAQALVEACLLSRRGAQVVLPSHLDPFVSLFSESSARVLLGVSRAHAPSVAELCSAGGVPVTRLGEIHPTPVLEIAPLVPLTLTELRAAWESTLPALFGTPLPR
jgi:phosphoribosylformylglycinamidine synthase